MNNSQLLKGILEGCILIVLNKNSYYGYELAEELKRYGLCVTQGTLYPLLLRLESKDYVEPYYEDSEFGPKRKYYKITELGKKEIEIFLENFNEMKKFVERIID